MPVLPDSAEFTGSTVTQAQFKTALTNQRAFLAGLLGATGSAVDARIAMGALGNTVVVKSGAFTVLAADAGKVFHCYGTWSVALSTAAALGVGFNCIIINAGTGTITVDPAGTEQIDLAATKPLSSGNSSMITCDGTGFFSAAGGGSFAATTSMLFMQTAAPTGWVKQTGHNDKTLRIVSGTAGSGGSVAFSTVFGRTGTDNHTITLPETASHSHPVSPAFGPEDGENYTGGFAQRNISYPPSQTATAVGGNLGHNHTVDLRVTYVDAIIANKS